MHTKSQNRRLTTNCVVMQLPPNYPFQYLGNEQETLSPTLQESLWFLPVEWRLEEAEDRAAINGCWWGWMQVITAPDAIIPVGIKSPFSPDQVLFCRCCLVLSCFESGYHLAAPAVLRLVTILLPLPFKGQDNRCEPLCPVTLGFIPILPLMAWGDA